jgi:Icc-related predicted phosphoesterase
MTRFVFVGCLYQLAQEYNTFTVPEGDVLVFTGDLDTRWTWQMKAEHAGRNQLIQFNDWLGRQPHRHKLVVFGDQDIWCDDHEDEARKLLSNAKVLVDEEVEIDGLRVYGTPWTPNSMTPGPQTHAFNEQDSYIEHRWAGIPSGLDLLVTHCPPGRGGLAATIWKTRPLVHCFSHGAGQSSSDKTVSRNVEQFTPEGVVVGAPVELDLCTFD